MTAYAEYWPFIMTWTTRPGKSSCSTPCVGEGELGTSLPCRLPELLLPLLPIELTDETEFFALLRASIDWTSMESVTMPLPFTLSIWISDGGHCGPKVALGEVSPIGTSGEGALVVPLTVIGGGTSGAGPSGEVRFDPAVWTLNGLMGVPSTVLSSLITGSSFPGLSNSYTQIHRQDRQTPHTIPRSLALHIM